jgi:flagellar hook-associated protein 3 FlgL
MRVTEGMRYAQVTRNLAQLSSQQQAASERAATGLRVTAPSVDPIAAAELARARASQSQIAARQAAITSVRGDAELAEGALAQAGDLLARAKEITVQAANGSLGASDRAALALEVKGIKEALVGIGNTRGTRGYLFGGNQTTSAPFSAAGVFSGDDLTQSVDIGNSSPTVVSQSGAKAFTLAGGRDLFADLDSLYAALNANDQSAVAAQLDNIDAGQKQLLAVRADAGLTLNRLDASAAILDSFDTLNQKRSQDIGAADPIEAYSSLTQLGQALQRSVAVAQQILGTSNLWNSQ